MMDSAALSHRTKAGTLALILSIKCQYEILVFEMTYFLIS